MFSPTNPNGYHQITAKQYIDACNEQGVNLLLRPRNWQRIKSGNAWLLVVAAAQTLIDHGAGLKLADGPITTPIHPGDRVSRIVTRIINTRIEPVNAEDYQVAFDRQSGREALPCSTAEPTFAKNLLDMKEGRVDESKGLKHGGEVFINKAGHAVLLRKATNWVSAMTLVETPFDDVVFEAGTLVTADTGDVPLDHNTLPRRKLRVRPVEDIRHINVRRLTAFASPPDQRHISGHMIEHAGAALDLMYNLGPNELQPVVQGAVDLLLSQAVEL